jgi:DNA-binding response OmpR family regulator
VDIRILIIDNNRDFANIFAKLLQIKGFSVSVEATFKNGLQYLKHKLYHIVFVDIPLPEYSESQILNLLKENEIFKKSRVLLFSSIDLDNTELNEWKKYGLYLYLKKPIKRDVMIKTLENIRVEINSITSQTPTNSIEGSDEPTFEQLEKLNRLQKQIEKLENIQQSTSVQNYSLPKKIEDIPKESNVTTNTMDYNMLKNIVSHLKRKSTFKPGEYSLNPSIEVNPKDKEIIKKEIEKTRLEISTLKNKILLFEDVDSQDLQHGRPSSGKKKRKIKKKPVTAKVKKRKIKK